MHSGGKRKKPLRLIFALRRKVKMTNHTDHTSYDEVPYGSYAFSQSHPDRLATLGRLFGMSPAPLTRCRVLELGCASGGNLLPMAFQLPDSEFAGVDLSAKHVEKALKTIQEMGMKNVRIKQASILDVDESWGKFDYIICHGVYSWVPKEVQDKIISVSSANLAPNGIVYVSYNTYPGWHMRDSLRHMMLYHIRHFKGMRQQIDQAKALIDFLSRHVPTENNAYGMLLKNELDILNKLKDWHFFHDHLEEVNAPVYFHQFAEHAARHNLQYLGEAELGTMLMSKMPKEVAEELGKINKDIVATEQYMDFFRNRYFRQTLLCHRGVRLKRNLNPGDVKNQFVASVLTPEKMPVDLSPGVLHTFRTPRGQTVSTSRPLTKAALAILRENWPCSISFDMLSEEAIKRMDAEPALKGQNVVRDWQALAGDLLQGYTVSAVEFHAWQGNSVSRPGERPKASPFAVCQSRQGEQNVVNLRHEQVPVDPLTQHLLNALDGTRDRAALFDYLGQLISNGTLNAQSDNEPVRDPELIRKNLEKDIEQRLAYLAVSALLME